MKNYTQLKKRSSNDPPGLERSKTLVILFFILFVLAGNSMIYAQEGGYAETNGVKIYYETHGEGDPLLLLHGFSLSHQSWELWIEDLSRNHLLIIPDLRGHGLSSNPSNIFTHKMSAMDMYGLMDHLKIDRFKAIGQSTGAMTLTHMATMDTSRMSSMILIATTSFFPDQARQQMRGANYENWKTHMEPLHPGGEDQIKMLIAQFHALANTYDDMNFTSPYLATIKCPTLIIHGDRDPLFPVEIALNFYKSIPDSYLWIVPNDGHIPIGIYDRKSIWSDVFLKVTNDFFAGNWK